MKWRVLLVVLLLLAALVPLVLLGGGGDSGGHYTVTCVDGYSESGGGPCPRWCGLGCSCISTP